jgi:segregation and condensation protein A
VDSELESLNLFKLLKAFERVIQRFDDAHPKTVHQIIRFDYTIEDQQTRILGTLKKGKKATFKSVFGACRNRIHAIVTFLSLLELLNSGIVSIIIGEGVNNFWLTEAEPKPADEIDAEAESASEPEENPEGEALGPEHTDQKL